MERDQYNWVVDPDGRMTEDRKNGPVTTYHMSQGDMAKYKEGVKLMNEIKEVMEEKKVEDAMEYKAEKKKNLTRNNVLAMAAQGMTDEEIFDYYNNGLRKESFIKARIAHYKKPPEPKNEPEVETVKDEPKPDTDMWASVAQAQAQMQEEDTDLLHADLWQALGKFVDGDTNVETLAMLRHVAGKILSADRSVK